MAKRRRAAANLAQKQSKQEPTRVRYDADETFDNSEDEFYAAKDKILLEEPPSKRQRRDDDDIHFSDEEVLRDESDTDEEDDYNWGSKAEYYNADVIETEADALEEEQEARRLQQKQLQGMTEADFGFDESQWKDQAAQAVKTEAVSDVLVDELGSAQRLKLLNARYPELEPLAADFEDLQEECEDLRLSYKAEANSVTSMKYRALSGYLGAISLYFVLLSEKQPGKEGRISAKPAIELRQHPIMDTLLRCKTLWDTVKVMQPLPEILPEPVVEEPVQVVIKEIFTKVKAPKPILQAEKLEEPVKAPKKQKVPKTELADLLALAVEAEDSDLGDEQALTAQEAAEKARKKKSLRFYTSQMTQKSNKRGAASREAGGDDDVPRKERIRDRQARLQQEAERRGREAPDEHERLDDATGVDNASDPDQYYQEIATKSKQKKLKPDNPVAQEALEEEGTDGKRGITYAIAKNKGLMPRRKKEVRNPRVKKRMKFNEKQKKLGSVRPVWKGGEGRGGYRGELTGIKANVVKSVKL